MKIIKNIGKSGMKLNNKSFAGVQGGLFQKPSPGYRR